VNTELHNRVLSFRLQYPNLLDRRQLERVLNRLTIALMDKLEPYFFAHRMTRATEHYRLSNLRSYTHLAMFVHDLIAMGRDTYERVYRDPIATLFDSSSLEAPASSASSASSASLSSANDLPLTAAGTPLLSGFAPDIATGSGFVFLTLFSYDLLVRHAVVHRMFRTFTRPEYEMEEPPGLPGFLYTTSVIEQIPSPPPHMNGEGLGYDAPERLPRFARNDDNDFILLPFVHTIPGVPVTPPILIRNITGASSPAAIAAAAAAAAEEEFHHNSTNGSPTAGGGDRKHAL
jgi:hypothetical protein